MPTQPVTLWSSNIVVSIRGSRPKMGRSNTRMEVPMERRFDRTAEDLGNIVALEHVNVTVPDQLQATIFYIAGLGLTRDPYLMTGPTNMWVNVGRSQFHLPTSKAQVLRGHTGIVVSDRAALVRRLERTRKRLEGTRFDFMEREE